MTTLFNAFLCGFGWISRKIVLARLKLACWLAGDYTLACNLTIRGGGIDLRKAKVPAYFDNIEIHNADAAFTLSLGEE